LANVDWATILPGIQTLLVSVTGLRSANVGDADEGKQKFISPVKKGQLSFKVISVRHIGRDETRLEEVDVDGDIHLEETVCGNREFTLQLLFEGYDHAFTKFAEYYLERIFTKLSRRTSKTALAAVGVSWTGVTPFVNLSRVISNEDRVYSRGARDFTFLTAVNDHDDDPSEWAGWIETVELYSNPLKDVSGDPASVQVSFTGPPEAL
jgi:hypothetical protein